VSPATTYQVELKPSAARVIRKLDKDIQRRVIARAEALADEPRPSGAGKLEGMRDLYRIRVGDYRIIYQVADKVLLVLVVRAGHRRDAYR
jgi:mRNA interferase RelE/StbE